MSSLKNILNPPERRRSVKLSLPEQSTSTWGMSVSHPSPGSSSEDDEEQYNPLIHIPHPDCPDSLACLPDTDGRPQHTLPVILRCAILGSPRKRLTIREIYAAMEEKYAYYRTAGQTWKQSVRHHLSLNRLFERQPRPATDPGFGSYWTVNLAAPPGTKRPRKRGRPNKDAQPKKNEAMEEGTSKPRRGRPRKDDSPVPSTSTPPYIEPSIDPALLQPMEPLVMPSQRPPIQLPDDGEVNMLVYEDELIDELESHASDHDDECESEEKLLHPFERRQSLSGGLTPYDSSGGFHFSPQLSSDTSHQQASPQPTLVPAPHPMQILTPRTLSPPQLPSAAATPPPRVQSMPPDNASPVEVQPEPIEVDLLPLDNPLPRTTTSPQLSSSRRMSPDGDKEEIIEQLQNEMAILQRRYAEEISNSRELSDKLARAHAELSRTRSALEAGESKWRQELNRRMEAERVADDARRLRDKAEEALQSFQHQSEMPRLTRGAV
ncbi:hypothetical protein C8F04DRAFT_1083298 [Mycena alexandri]|uniref:Fork-head domain-containing protein n=1 Tax=Mycena alexandri TaxID=1745969 RepID=A0AAD6X8A8_9AGAR|nr:hypothetical protein C8F04DRAFT_1083298 [Mycena alexandri]